MGVRWKEMDRKMLDFKSYGICELVLHVPGVRTLRIGWVLHWNAIFEKNKARFVNRTNNQESGIDYTESSSPVMGLESPRTSSHSGLMSSSLISHLPASHHLQGGDLYGGPDSHADPRERNWVWYLKKGLCGLVQAGRIWSEELDSHVKSGRFELGCWEVLGGRFYWERPWEGTRHALERYQHEV